MIEELEGCSYFDRLRILGLITLETRFVKADLIEVYKIFNSLDSLDPGRVFVQDICVTREYPGNDAKLIRCVLGMTLNSSVVVQGMTVKLRPCWRFRACG